MEGQEVSPAVRELLRDYSLIAPIRLVWGEMDAFGHLNNVFFFRYFETARIQYFEKFGMTREGGRPTGVGPILASTACQYRAPLTYPDLVYVGARLGEIGEDRFSMEYLLVSEKLQKPAATGSAVIVSYDYQQGRKVKMPDDWRAALSKEKPAANKDPQ